MDLDNRGESDGVRNQVDRRAEGETDETQVEVPRRLGTRGR